MASSAKKQKRPEGKGMGPRPFKRGIPRVESFKATHLGNHVDQPCSNSGSVLFFRFHFKFHSVLASGGAGKNVGVPRGGAGSSSVVLFVGWGGDTLLNFLCERSVAEPGFTWPQTILRSPEGKGRTKGRRTTLTNPRR